MNAKTFDNTGLPSRPATQPACPARRFGGASSAGPHLPAIGQAPSLMVAVSDLAAVTEVALTRRVPEAGDTDATTIGGARTMRRLGRDGGCGSVTLENVKFERDQKVAYRASRPISNAGGVVGLHGLSAPVGAIGEVAGMMTRTFGDLDVRFGADKGRCADHHCQHHDRDVPNMPADRRGDAAWRAAELIGAERAGRAVTAPSDPYQSGILRTHADQVGSARKGAVTHAGGRAEIGCNTDH